MSTLKSPTILYNHLVKYVNPWHSYEGTSNGTDALIFWGGKVGARLTSTCHRASLGHNDISLPKFLPVISAPPCCREKLSCYGEEAETQGLRLNAGSGP